MTENKKTKKKPFLPMSMRPHAHDNVRVWTFYSAIHSYLNEGDVSFQDVMVSGFAVDENGHKISKSKGNAKFSPEELVGKYGADVTRYRACGGTLGKDTVFIEKELDTGKKLLNKLRNTFQFAKMQLGDFEMPKKGENEEKINFVNFAKKLCELCEKKNPKYENFLYPTDQRILTRLKNLVETITKHLDEYEYGLARIKFEEFFRNDFCDMYLELIKTRLYKPELFENGEQKKKSGQITLFFVLYNIIKLRAPYMPHITEEIYQDYFKQFVGQKSIHINGFPEVSDFPEFGNTKTISDFDSVIQIVEKIRRYKADSQISLGAELKKLKIGENFSTAKSFEDDIRGVTKALEIEWTKDGEITIEN